MACGIGRKRERYYGCKGKSLNRLITIVSGLDFLLFGYDQGVMGGLLTLPSFVETFPEIDTTNDKSYHTALYQGLVVASYNLGCFGGAVVTIFLGDRLGRRRMIFLGSSIMIIGAILQATSFSIVQFIIGRVLTGFGNGMNTSTVPTWASETSESHERGKLVMFQGAMVTGGIALSYWLDLGTSRAGNNGVSWRFPIAFQILPAVIILMSILELPESPRWLVLKGDIEEARAVLTALEVPSTGSSDASKQVDEAAIELQMAQRVEIKLKEITSQVDEAANTGYRDMFTMGPDRNFHRVILAYFVQVMQQISGINVITYYAATIFEQYIHLSSETSRYLAAGNGTAYFAASFIAPFTIEKFGRRKSLLLGSIGLIASMVILAIMTRLSEEGIGGKKPGIVSTTFLFVFNTFFAIGWLAIPWLYPAEIVPLKIRAPANGLSTSANWIFNFMVVMITPVAFNSIGYKTYIIFAVINAAMFPAVYFFYPETAFRSLEEMDTIFQNTTSFFDAVSVAKNQAHRYGADGKLLVAPEIIEEMSGGGVFVQNDIGKDSENGTIVHRENVADDSGGSTTSPKN
ncbi:uncharacterized protein EAF01_011995 [Botrytis porri]|nr:uncharacterized protein EAF01_011995 [Botrytis porri]KAF7880726.1 hypothetical protein EAF01_011995 [Botrytis porri]